MVQEIIFAALASGMTATAICWWAMPIGEWLGILDEPDASRKLHDTITPLVGGLAVACPTVIIALYISAGVVTPSFAVLSFASFAALVIGLFDDRHHMSPTWRLVLTIGIAVASVYFIPDFELSFLQFSFLSQSFFLEGWSTIFSVLCLVGLLNAVNMADGKNGLVIGLGLVWSILLALYLPEFALPLLGGLFAGLLVVFLFNMNGQIFLGDSGSYALSILFGLLAIYAYNINFAYIRADAVALWFLVPVLDCVRLMVWRVLQGRSPFSPDRSHLHHVLDRIMPWKFGLPIYLSFVALPAILAYLTPQYTGLWLLGVCAIYVTALLVFARRGSAFRAA